MREHDVIVSRAGPAGTAVARELAGAGGFTGELLTISRLVRPCLARAPRTMLHLSAHTGYLQNAIFRVQSEERDYYSELGRARAVESPAFLLLR